MQRLEELEAAGRRSRNRWRSPEVYANGERMRELRDAAREHSRRSTRRAMAEWEEMDARLRDAAGQGGRPQDRYSRSMTPP